MTQQKGTHDTRGNWYDREAGFWRNAAGELLDPSGRVFSPADLRYAKLINGHPGAAPPTPPHKFIRTEIRDDWGRVVRWEYRDAGGKVVHAEYLDSEGRRLDPFGRPWEIDPELPEVWLNRGLREPPKPAPVSEQEPAHRGDHNTFSGAGQAMGAAEWRAAVFPPKPRVVPAAAPVPDRLAKLEADLAATRAELAELKAREAAA